MRFFILAILLLTLTGRGQQDTLISFELEDHFKKKYRRENFTGEVTILVGSDREGSGYNEKWSFAIYDSLKASGRGDMIRFLPVADLRGVPFFMKGWVKGKFPQEPKRWILMDWKGIFPRAYDFKPGHSNILILTREGLVIHQCAVQEIDPSVLGVCLDKLYGILDIR